VSEPRKASDVLLDLEAKVDKLIGLTEAQNLNAKILSNKLNEVMTALSKQSSGPGKITVEAVNTKPTSPLQNFQPMDPERQVPIFAEAKLPETDSPQGFRRTSRPETFSGDTVIPVVQEESSSRFPPQIIKGGPPPGRGPGSEVTVPLPQAPPKQTAVPQKSTNKAALVQNAIPVHQRVVDKNGKSIFLANVEVTDLSNAQSTFKTRTNGTGKWMASLAVGAYRVTIKKQESLNKDKTALEAIQDIQIDGKVSPLELHTLIIK
jgi:hypothetical protein